MSHSSFRQKQPNSVVSGRRVSPTRTCWLAASLLAGWAAADLASAQAVPPEPGTAGISFSNFRGASLFDVVDIVARRLGINYVVDPAVPDGTVTVNSYGQLGEADLFPLLETILRMNGAAAVQVGNIYQIVPLDGIMSVAIDPLEAGTELPEDERPVLNAIRLRHSSAEQLAAILEPFLGPGGQLAVEGSTNTLLLLDNARNMHRTMDLVELFDTAELVDYKMRLFEIENSLATTLAAELEEVFRALPPSDRREEIRFLPLPRIGAVLAVSASDDALEKAASWVRELDRGATTGGRRNFVYRAQYGEAANLAATVQQLYASTAIPGGATPALDGALPSGSLPAVEAVPAIRIVADPINNLVLVQATQQEWDAVRGTLLELDAPPRQVLIDAKIYEVNLSGSLASGVSAYLRKRSVDGAARRLAGSLTGAGVTNLSIGMLVGSTRELALFLEASATEGRTRVISAPSLIATDNIPAEIVVGQTIPTLSSQAVVGGAFSEGSSLFTNTVSNVQTGVSLSVTARVNASGIVTLRIQQEVSTPSGITGSIQSPTIDRRNVTTQVTVNDGDTVAIGGIIQESSIYSSARVPILGRIPVIGRAFGSTEETTSKTELIVLLEPHVIYDQNQISSATDELRARLQALRRIVRESEPVGEDPVAE